MRIGVVLVVGRSGFGVRIDVVLVVVDSNDKYTKRKMSASRAVHDNSINICIQAAGLRLGLLTAVLSDIVHSVMVTVEVPVT